MENEKEKEKEVYDWYQDKKESRKYWRGWGSWFSWGSPVGLGLFFIEIGIFIWLLHLANIIR
jgi:hypothetical protein